jgi:long-chain acyl-CoA synthetase
MGAHNLISQVMVVGEGKPFIGALVTLDPDALKAWAGAHHKTGRTAAELHDDPDLKAEIQAAVDDANAAVSKAESIRAWRLIDAQFTEESGHMTPTLKLKRAVVASDHAEDIEALYTR